MDFRWLSFHHVEFSIQWSCVINDAPLHGIWCLWNTWIITWNNTKHLIKSYRSKSCISQVSDRNFWVTTFWEINGPFLGASMIEKPIKEFHSEALRDQEFMTHHLFMHRYDTCATTVFSTVAVKAGGKMYLIWKSWAISSNRSEAVLDVFCGQSVLKSKGHCCRERWEKGSVCEIFPLINPLCRLHFVLHILEGSIKWVD